MCVCGGRDSSASHLPGSADVVLEDVPCHTVLAWCNTRVVAWAGKHRTSRALGRLRHHDQDRVQASGPFLGHVPGALRAVVEAVHDDYDRARPRLLAEREDLAHLLVHLLDCYYYHCHNDYIINVFAGLLC